MALPKWLELLKQIGPIIVAATVPGGAILAPIIVSGIATAEQIPGASGPEKKQHVIELATAAAQGINAAAGKPVIDPVTVQQVAGSAIDTVVGSVNLAHKNSETPVL